MICGTKLKTGPTTLLFMIQVKLFGVEVTNNYAAQKISQSRIQ